MSPDPTQKYERHRRKGANMRLLQRYQSRTDALPTPLQPASPSTFLLSTLQPPPSSTDSASVQIKWKEKDSLVIDRIYRSPSSSTTNNDFGAVATSWCRVLNLVLSFCTMQSRNGTNKYSGVRSGMLFGFARCVCISHTLGIDLPLTRTLMDPLQCFYPG